MRKQKIPDCPSPADWPSGPTADLPTARGSAINTTTQNLWDTVKAVLRGKFIAIQAHLKNKKKVK